jgi:hypothetical protein
LVEMNPLGADAQHELCRPRKGPRFFEEQVGVPLRRIASVEGRYACFNFQPILYGRNLRCKAACAACCSSLSSWM